MTTPATEEQVVAALTADGFRIHETGGGCTAWRKDLANGRYILITNSDGSDCQLSTSYDDFWLIALYGDDGEPEYLDAANVLTLAEAVAFARLFAEER